MSDADYEKRQNDVAELTGEIFLKLGGQDVRVAMAALIANISNLYKNNRSTFGNEPEVFEYEPDILLDLQEDDNEH